MHRLGQCWMNSEERLSLNAMKKLFITNSSQLMPNKIAKFFKKNYCDSNRNFREVHQQDLMKQKELQKFQNSTFDEFAQKKLIEVQKIIMELSGRLQELQNEVNCMNDSRDFRDAESTCSGNPHVTSPPGLFPKHPPFEGMLRPCSLRSDKMRSCQIFVIHPVYQETFLHIHKLFRQLRILRN